MLRETLVVGPLEVNCYIIGDPGTKEAMVVDPGDEPDRIMERLRELGLTVKYLVCTHAHFDHVGALPELKKDTGAPIALHKDEIEIYQGARDMAAFWGYNIEALPEPDLLVQEGDKIRFGELSFEVLHTPGHSPGGICLYGNGVVITGDTLFAGSVGRTDFYGGDLNKLRESFRRLLELPEDTEVLPGHGPTTTIGIEKRENMFAEEL